MTAKKRKPLTAQQRQLRVVCPEPMWDALESYATANGFEGPHTAARELLRQALVAHQGAGR